MGGFKMVNKSTLSLFDRRKFLANILPAGSLFCLGCRNLFSLPLLQEQSQDKANEHKFQHNSNLTFEQAFQFAYQGNIGILQKLADDIGKDKFIEMLKKAASEFAAEGIKQALNRLPNNDFATFVNLFVNNPQFKNTFTFDVVEQSNNVFEIKVTECLWAKTVRGLSQPNAAELGYASICYPDYAVAKAFNPKLKMIRDKTLMQGDAYCNHRYIFEG
jgi:hypothetical protein